MWMELSSLNHPSLPPTEQPRAIPTLCLQILHAITDNFTDGDTIARKELFLNDRFE